MASIHSIRSLQRKFGGKSTEFINIEQDIKKLMKNKYKDIKPNIHIQEYIIKALTESSTPMKAEQFADYIVNEMAIKHYPAYIKILIEDIKNQCELLLRNKVISINTGSKTKYVINKYYKQISDNIIKPSYNPSTPEEAGHSII